MSIHSLLNQIENDEIVLPAIQRDFVWDEEKISMLLDSIMRGYPVGIVLLWETYNDLQYRKFIKEYRRGNRYTFLDNTKNKKLKVVLDGQQRLSSLYMALYGTFDGKSLYFNALSGDQCEDFSEIQYEFYFGTEKEAIKWNKESIEAYQLEVENKNYCKEYSIKVKDLFGMTLENKLDLVTKVKNEYQLSVADEKRMQINLGRIDDVLIKDSNILKATIIDEDVPRNSPKRKTEADVLEIFVRINTEGVNLNRSDLIFSMLKLNWKESAESLPNFIDNINEGNSFEINIDLVIRALFAVSDLGTKFDIDILRNQNNVELIKNNFNKCCNAIESAIDFVQTSCWCASSKVIGGRINLIPIVYYLFNIKNHQVPNSEIDKIRKAFMLIAFLRPFSRYADSRLGTYIKRVLKSQLEQGTKMFPLEDTAHWLNYWAGFESFNSDVLSDNIYLTLHLLQEIRGAKVHYKKNLPEIDHIFPRSKLREKKDLSEGEINHYANFWILGKNKNQNKSNKDPKKYFMDVPDSQLNKVFIKRDLLIYSKYKKFLRERSELIIKHLKKRLEFRDDEFDYLFEHD